MIEEKEILQSKVIDLLRFPMIVGIVLLHAFLESIKGLDVPETGIPIYHTLSFFISRIIVCVAVPLFFFISGYLFFYHTSFTFDIYKKKLSSRVRTLLIPYLFWNLVVLAGHWIVSLLSPVELTSGAYKLVRNYTLGNYIHCFWDINGAMPINGVLWFIRDLMIIVVCSPLIYLVIRYFRWYALVVLGSLWGIGVTLEIPHISAVFFFSLGAWFSINKRNFVVDFKYFFPWGVLIYLFIAIGIIRLRGTVAFLYVSNVGILLGIISVIAIATQLVEMRRWKASSFLVSSCFLVYAFHQLPLNMLNRILFKVIEPIYDWHFVFIYFVSPLIVIVVDVLFYVLLKKFVPQFVAVITGGRS